MERSADGMFRMGMCRVGQSGVVVVIVAEEGAGWEER